MKNQVLIVVKNIFFILSALAIIFGSGTNAFGQCENTTKYPSSDIMASKFNNIVEITNFQYAGDYFVIKNLVLNKTYRFASSNTNDYITVRDIQSGALLSHGNTPHDYIVGAGPDIVQVHINLTSPPCGTEYTNRTSTAQCIDCPDVPPMIGVNNSTMQATLDVGGEIKLGDSGRVPVEGMIRWNDNSQDFEGYNGTKWVSLTQSNVSGQFGKLKPSELNEDHKITASDGAYSNYFGESVSISGDYAIIGARSNDLGSNSDQGSAYIFHRNENTWTQQAKLTASDGATNDYFGNSVSISGDYAIIGAYADDIGSNLNQGAAYIFNRSGNSWTQQSKLTASDGAEGEYFGNSVSISGDYAIIGARSGDTGSNSEQGSAYVFHRSGSTWTQQAKLTASDGAAYDVFGYSVSISANYAIVGAASDDIGSNSNQGSAYIFIRSGITWTQQSKLTASDGAAADYFGTFVSISGDYAIIGAIYADVGSSFEQGSAYIYNRIGTSWTQQSKLTASDGAGGDYFGASVSIAGDYAIVGAYGNNMGNSFDQGSAYIFNRNGTSWTQQAKLTASDGAGSDYFGFSVYISGDYTIVGAYEDDIGSNSEQGSAYIMEKK